MTEELLAIRPGRRVLVALDGSPAAATALPLARAVAAQLGARLTLLHVAAAREAEIAIRHRIAADQGDLGALALEVPIADPATAIVARASDPAVALVVLTTHGREVVPVRALGTVAAGVVARATVPILLVRPATAARASAPLRRLLAPLDGAPSTEGALLPVARLAAQLGASVDLLYIAGQTAPTRERGTLRMPRYVDQGHYEWSQWAAEAADHLRACCLGWPATVPLRVFFARGDVGTVIARFAATGRYDATILERRSRLEPGRAAVLRAVLERTPCPILLVGVPRDENPA